MIEARELVERTVEFVREHETLVEVVLFALAFGESLVLVSFFIPASLLFLAIGGLQGATGGALWPLILAGTAGAFLGDLVSYAIGWHYKEGLQRTWPFSRNPKWLPLARTFFDRYGIAGVCMAKFVGPMRPLIPAVSGAVSMPSRSFLPASAVSSFVWSVVFLAPAYYGVDWLMR